MLIFSTVLQDDVISSAVVRPGILEAVERLLALLQQEANDELRRFQADICDVVPVPRKAEERLARALLGLRLAGVTVDNDRLLD